MGNSALSVIIPNYNHGHYIAKALEAILSQSFRPLEVIVVDDDSGDDSVEVIEKYAELNPAVQLLRNDRNMGVVFSVSWGLEHASGDYVYLAAADDRIFPKFFERSMNLLLQYPQAAICCSDYATFEDDTSIVREHRFCWSDEPCYFSPDEFTDVIKIHGGFLPAVSSIVKRSLVSEISDSLSELKWHSDWFANFVIALRHGVCYVPEIQAALRVRSASYSASGVRQKQQQYQLYKYMLDLLHSPDYADLFDAFRRSGLWPIYNFRALCALVEEPRYWNYLSVTLVKRMLWNGMRGTLVRVLPSFVKKFYRRLHRANRNFLVTDDIST